MSLGARLGTPRTLAGGSSAAVAGDDALHLVHGFGQMRSLYGRPVIPPGLIIRAQAAQPVLEEAGSRPTLLKIAVQTGETSGVRSPFSEAQIVSRWASTRRPVTCG